MGYTTLVSGTTITSAWANASVRDQVVTPFASRSARDSAITAPLEGMVAPITGDDVISFYNGTGWVTITPVSAQTAADQSTASTSYTDLSTVGPSLSIETATKALVTLSTVMFNSGSNNSFMGFAVSGATTLAAADARAIVLTGTNGASVSSTFLVTGLTAGVNTFTAKYKASAGTASFVGAAQMGRSMIVVGIP